MTVSATTSRVWPLNNESTSGETNAAMTITTTSPTAITPPVSAPRWMTGALPVLRARRAAIARAISCSSGWKKPGAAVNARTHNTASAL